MDLHLAALEQQALTVSRYVGITDEVLKKLGTAVVKGEISELKRQNHLYFKLKDEEASVDCLMWGSQVRQLPFEPQVGMQVIVVGSSSLYQKRGIFRLMAQQMYQAGRGLIMQRLEELKRRLYAEGVFTQEKRPIPHFIDRVGIITSGEGRVLHDIKTTLLRRNPLIEVVLYPALVQGNDAPASLCQALARAYAEKSCDVLIIGRGGGSFEDLLPFSDEEVVRLTAKSPLPIISAVGHEPDYALTDFAADMRAPTPTAAAEMVSAFTREELARACEYFPQALEHFMGVVLDDKVNEYARLKQRLQAAGPAHQLELKAGALSNLQGRLNAALERRLTQSNERLWHLQQRLGAFDPAAACLRADNLLKTLTLRADNAIKARLSKAQQEFLQRTGKLSALNPLAILSRGYSVTYAADGSVASPENIKPGDQLTSRLEQAEVVSTVQSIRPLKQD
ncbi:MAG: exodeoxyribonuclease VII large subunit [Proteobacteria bacterium]|uniref:Exodeoxyribonuclease 7 large subunit n=1 Tax=Candidatus Avisuccinivibrio stercorigallinarum TaxID=2840704 RepID=A0A9D9DD17_9GAMM|nr:exodeoxyribonuclease VII large subunit [Candidatus Avisuccinivibrio stercorigallinarum]